MRVFLPVVLSFLLAGSAAAQRGGGGGGGSHGGGGGGFHGGGMSGGGYRGGGFGGGGGFRGGGFTGGGFRGGVGGFRGGAFDHDGFGRFGFRGGFGVGFYGGYWPNYYPFWDGGYAYDWPGYYQYPDYGYAAPAYYGGYAASPNVTVVYPSNASAPVYERPTPVTHEYDQYGQEIHQPGGANANTNASPIYLVAFKDHSIAAAAAYWVDGHTLHYVNLQHEEKQASLDTVDRDFSLQLNRERHISFQLPQ